MDQWRGTLIQLACLASLVALVGLSKGASTDVIHIALGAVATVLGQSVARARVDATRPSGGSGGGSGGAGTSKPPPALGVLVGGALAVLVLVPVALASRGVSDILVMLNR